MQPDNQPRKGRPRVFGPQELPSADRKVVPVPMFKVKGFRRDVSIDLREHAPPAVVADFTRAFQELCGERGEWRSEHTIEKRVYHVLFFFEFLRQVGFNKGISQLSADVFESYEAWLISNKTSSERYGRTILAAVIVVMRTMEDSGFVDFQPALSRRLSYISAKPFKGGKVRDAYHPAVTRQLRLAARADLAAIRQRFLRLDDDAPLSVRNILAELDSAAQSRVHFASDDLVQEYCKLVGRNDFRGAALELNSRHHLTIEDAISFIVLLSVDTGLEQESIKDLVPGCVRRSDDGKALVAYRKNRAIGSEDKELVIGDSGKFSPSSVLETLEEVTNLTRSMTNMPYLVTYIGMSKLRPYFTRAPGPALARWVGRHGVVDENGLPLILNISRLRKGNKSILYRQTGGDHRFVVNHTKKVAYEYYANVPQLKDLHERAVVGGLMAAFGAPAAIAPEADAEVLPQTWVASCKRPDNSPYGNPEGICASPFWGCLDCGNAVFSDSKIPALTAFALAMRRERLSMTESEWRQKFGRAYHRITEHILPKLPENLVAAAFRREGREDVPYLPPGVLS